MRSFIVVLMTVPLLLAAKSADAALMTGVSSLDLVNGTVGPISVVGNEASFTLTVLKKAPIRLKFDYISGANPLIPGVSPTTGYILKMKIVNGLLPATGGGPDYMNGYDIVNGAAGNVANVTANLFTDTAPTSTKFGVTDNGGGFTLPTGYRVGGLDGGGGAIYNGGFSDDTVVLSVSGFTTGSGTRSSFLTFTANPEPATLLLGSLAMIPATVLARRRRKAAQELVEAA
jgi:hypothetical protein